MGSDPGVVAVAATRHRAEEKSNFDSATLFFETCWCWIQAKR